MLAQAPRELFLLLLVAWILASLYGARRDPREGPVLVMGVLLLFGIGFTLLFTTD